MDLADINYIQVQLIHDSDLDPIPWIERHSANFRKIISEGVFSIDEIKFLLYKS